jgi:hypothetical protein
MEDNNKIRKYVDPVDDLEYREDAGPKPKSLEWFIELPIYWVYSLVLKWTRRKRRKR